MSKKVAIGGAGLQVVVLLFLNASCARSQRDDFISIDCGSTAPLYVDPSRIEWQPDGKYISTGENYAASSAPSNFARELTTLRYFPNTRAKHCYELPAKRNETYLLRASWLYSAYAEIAPTPPLFSLVIDATAVLNVSSWDPSRVSSAWHQEFVHVARTDSLSVCLLRNPSSPSDPFISALEMRPGVDWWSDEPLAFQGRYFTTVFRNNYGGSKMLRYPDDPFDRYWNPAVPLAGVYENVSTASVIDNRRTWGFPPSVVMQTAVSSAGNLTFSLSDRGTQFVGYWISYVTEIVANATPRSFGWHFPSLGVDSTTYLPLPSPDVIEEGYNGRAIDFPPGLTLTLYPVPNSTLGPLLNAMELYEVRSIAAGTSSGDASVIAKIKADLNLTNWNGDPCLPVPHDWVYCDTKVPAHVIALNLTNYNLTGFIPNGIANLTSLKTLHLENNMLTGSIPDWLARMPTLQSLFLQNNNLSGLIPQGLLQLQEFKFDGNPGLGNGTVNQQIRSSSHPNIGAIIGVVAGVLAILVAGLVIFCILRRRARTRHPQTSGSLKGIGTSNARPFSLQEITTATNNFQTQIGRSGFGPVYYGKLADGQEVAVKVSDADSHQPSKEFLSKVALLSTIHHRNLVKLLGYCVEDEQQILVYEFLHGGSLHDHLYGNGSSNSSRQSLGWEARLDIAVDAARGLEYLHNGCDPQIVHRDFKSSSILLSKDMKAKVADFGFFRPATDVLADHAKGSLGYTDPGVTDQLSPKSDVYSFGMVLLEIITGRPPVDLSLPHNDPKRVLCDWARMKLQRGEVDALLDSVLTRSSPDKESVWRVVEIAMQCVEPKPLNRPLMSDVVRDLDIVQSMCGNIPRGVPMADLSSNIPRGVPMADLSSSASYPYSDLSGR